MIGFSYIIIDSFCLKEKPQNTLSLSGHSVHSTLGNGVQKEVHPLKRKLDPNMRATRECLPLFMLLSASHLLSRVSEMGDGSGGGEVPWLKMKLVSRATGSLKGIRGPLCCVQGPSDSLDLPVSFWLVLRTGA